MAISNARDYLKEFGLDQDILEFEVSSATVEEAAKAINTDAKHITKTLAFRHELGPILVCTAGDAKIDNAKFKNQFKLKARMLSPEELRMDVGHEMGGVCPFGVKDNCQVYCDISMKRFDAIYPACGSSNSAIRMDCETLFKTSKAIAWVDVCKDWQ